MDDKDQQAYKELQNRMIETSQKQKFVSLLGNRSVSKKSRSTDHLLLQVDQQLRVTQLNMKKASLTQEELKPVSDDTKLYEAIGRA